jgi:hypothetical protein
MAEPTDLYERLYFHEIEVREQLNSRLQLPLSLIVVLAGAFAYLLQSADHSLAGYVSHAFKMALALTGSALLCSAYLFARAAWWHNYKFLPYANQTAHSWKELTEYDAKYGTAIADRTMAAYLKGHFIEGATANAHNNDLRSAYLHWCNMAVIITSGFALVAFLTFVLGDLGRKQSVTQVSIAQPVDIRGIALPHELVVVPDHTATAASGIGTRIRIVPVYARQGERNASTGPSAAATPSTSNASGPGGRSTSTTPSPPAEPAKETE